MIWGMSIMPRHWSKINEAAWDEILSAHRADRSLMNRARAIDRKFLKAVGIRLPGPEEFSFSDELHCFQLIPESQWLERGVKGAYRKTFTGPISRTRSGLELDIQF
jgi:hypothetical protein